MRTTLMSTIFFFNDTATTEIYTLSLHDALPISSYSDLLPEPSTRYAEIIRLQAPDYHPAVETFDLAAALEHPETAPKRSEEHTSELQSQSNLVCRLLLEKKNNTPTTLTPNSPRH